MENKKLLTTLCIVHQHPRILLGMKKRGFGAGRWNGFGEKVVGGETVLGSLLREVKEEAGIEIKNLEKISTMEFKFAISGEIVQVHLYKADKFKGIPTESEEMKPAWFFVDEIPFARMWPGDIYWMPLFLKGKKFKGEFLFGESDVILEKELKEVAEI